MQMTFIMAKIQKATVTAVSSYPIADHCINQSVFSLNGWFTDNKGPPSSDAAFSYIFDMVIKTLRNGK